MIPNRAHGASSSSSTAAAAVSSNGHSAIQRRVAYYTRLYRPPRRFHHLEYTLDPMLRPALQPCTRGGRSIGRPIILGSPRHRFLTTHLPRLFPPPNPDEHASLAALNAWLCDQRAASRRPSTHGRRRPPPSITRSFQAREWRILGFGTRRVGEAFIRQVRSHDPAIYLSTPSALRACLEQHHPSHPSQPHAHVHAEDPVLLDQAYRGYSRSYRLPHTGHATDYFSYGDMLQQAAIPVVQEAQGNDHRPVKASIACSGIFLRPVELDDDGTPAAYRDLLRAMQIGAPDWRIRQLIDAMSDDQRRQFIRVGRFETTMGLVVGSDGAGTVLNSQREEINSQIDRMTDQGSGWIFLWMLQGYVNILEHDFLEGGSYIPLPKTIQSRNACINPKNMDDDLCFLYSCVIALYDLCKPIYAGMAILDLSKLYMHEFWYDVLKARYAERLRLVYTDTDAFIYHVQTRDHYKDLMSMRHLFDFSGYDQGHFLYDPSNKKVTGMFKDETHGVPIKSVAAVRSKMYSLEIGDERVQKNTGKGIWKKALASIRHSDYVRAIFHEHQSENMSQLITTYKLRAVKHVLRVERQVKTSISSHDDKRYLLDDGLTQLPHGHWRNAAVQ